MPFWKIFLIWLIPASLELAIGALFVWVTRDKASGPEISHDPAEQV